LDLEGSIVKTTTAKWILIVINEYTFFL